MTGPTLAEQLAGGDRRGIGRVDTVAGAILADPRRLTELWACLGNPDPLIRTGAADALEKISRERPEMIAPWKGELLSGTAEDGTAEVRWNLLAIVPRLALTAAEADAFGERLAAYVDADASRIVRATALEALVTIGLAHPGAAPVAKRLLTAALDDSTPSLRARARRLLRRSDVRRVFGFAENVDRSAIRP